MSRTALAGDPRERLRAISKALQDLHRSLLEYQRRDYERSFGRIGSDFYVLKLAADDPQFAWLRALSAEMMRIDIAVSGGEVDETDLQLTGTRLRHLLTPSSEGNPFQSRYDAAMQVNPEIIMAHAGVMRALPPPRRVTLFRGGPSTDVRTDDEAPGFEFRLHHPGELVPGHGDHGYRALAAVGEVIFPAGAAVAMHPQANEEVISWVPEGAVEHEDARGATYLVDADHLAVMNAGAGFEHGERVPAGAGDARMIQFFIRPTAVELEPMFQHAEIPEVRPGEWRPLVGQEGDDTPFHVRNAVVMSDIVLPAGTSAPLPRRDGWDTYLFIYDGEVMIDGVPFGASDSAIVLQPQELTISARVDARVAALMLDPAAKVTRAGTVGR